MVGDRKIKKEKERKKRKTVSSTLLKVILYKIKNGDIF